MDKKIYDLTNPQKSIWYMEEYYKGTAINNICGSLTINEKVDFEKFKKAINLFVKLNESFQIRLLFEKSIPKQYFCDFEELFLQIGGVCFPFSCQFFFKTYAETKSL